MAETERTSSRSLGRWCFYSKAMDSKFLFALLGMLVCVTINLSVAEDSDEEGGGRRKPNIVFIMLDDVGYNDVGWNNAEVHTPHMDALARSGAILDRIYSDNVCSPSRTAFLTGKWPHRLGMQRRVISPDAPLYIPPSEKLMGQYLQDAGYFTHMLGKWHAGHCRVDYFPTRRGFNTFYGFLNAYTDSYTRCSSSRFRNDSAFDWYDQETVNKSRPGVHVTDLIKDRALDIIEKQSGDDPFFLFLSFTAPHIPIQVDPKYLVQYCGIQNQWRKEYLGMITHVDEAVGEVVDKLKEKGLFGNTVIAMTADNGGAPGPSSNAPLRGGKTSTFEGGHRVPGFITGPRSIIAKHNYRSNGKMHLIDWLPTFVNMAKGTIGSGGNLDGIDQSLMLQSGAPSARREVVYHLDSSGPFGYATLSYDNYKLVYKSSGLMDGWYQDGTFGLLVAAGQTAQTERVKRVTNHNLLCAGTLGPPYNTTLFGMAFRYSQRRDNNQTFLFDIEADPEERVDLSAIMPSKVAELKDRINAHFLNEMAPPPQVIHNSSVTQSDHAWITGWC